MLNVLFPILLKKRNKLRKNLFQYFCNPWTKSFFSIYIFIREYNCAIAVYKRIHRQLHFNPLFWVLSYLNTIMLFWLVSLTSTRNSYVFRIFIDFYNDLSPLLSDIISFSIIKVWNSSYYDISNFVFRHMLYIF